MMGLVVPAVGRCLRVVSGPPLSGGADLQTEAISRLSGASRRALIGTLIGSAPGFLLAFLVARHFGIGQITDAYAFAFGFAAFGVAVVSGVLETNVLPVAQHAQAAGRAKFLRFVRKTIGEAVLFAATGYGLMFAIGSALIIRRGGWPATEQREALIVLAILASFVLLVAASSVLAGCLYSIGDFVTPTITQSCRSIVPIAALPFLSTGAGATAVLASGIAVGELARVVILGTRLYRVSRPLRHRVSDSALPLWRTAAPVALSLLVVAVNPVIDRTFAAPLSPGSVTVLDLAEKVFFVPAMVLSSSIVLVSGARWAALFVGLPDRLVHDLRRTFAQASGAAVVLAVVGVGGVYAVGGLIGPTFAGTPTSHLERVIAILLIGLPPAVIMSAGARFLTSTRQTKALPLFATFAVLLNCGFDVVGARLYGVDGIAAATVVMRVACAAIYLLYCSRIARGFGDGSGDRSSRAAGITALASPGG
jgi:peptidoglycan biosynthesis protein MviN/MurJ (putative lipid II flippase)